MTTRLLPPEDWSRLDGTESAEMLQFCDPVATRVIVVEDGSEIVGAWVLSQHMHVDGLWIAPDYRKQPSVARPLMRAMQRLSRRLGALVVVATVRDDRTKVMAERLGGRPLQGTTYLIPVRDDVWAGQ